ncbi:hypothetical protein ACSBR1_011332 [Camellia fascicularis]
MIAKVDKSQRTPKKSSGLKKVFLRTLLGSALKGLVKPKPRTPADVVRQTRFLLMYLDANADRGGIKHTEKIEEINRHIWELKVILYGNSESEPAAEACAQLTQEFFRENTFRLLITCLPKLDLEARKDATLVVANLQRQQIYSRLIASDYLEANLDIMDHLISGYEDPGIALHYGGMLRECIRHQSVARYVLKSENMKKFFDYIQLPNFDVAADATATFKELLTRHKSTVAEYLSANYDWFFAEFNSKLLESSNYITRRQAVKESSKNIQIDAFHVFKLFAANQNKAPDIVNILIANRSKLLRFFSGFKIDKDDEQFEADKAQVVKVISELEP